MARIRFGDRLKALRQGKTQAELAEALGVSATRPSIWENNRETPHPALIGAIAKHYGMSVKELIAGTDLEGEMSIADTNLQADSAEDLLSFYINENAITFDVAGEQVGLPLVCSLRPAGLGRCSEQKLFFEVPDLPRYELPSELRRFSDPVRADAEKLGHFDGTVFRLEDITQSISGTTVTLRRASYFDALGTNFNMDSKRSPGGLTLRQFLHGRERRLCGSLKNDPLVNHLGVVIMVETKDGMLVVQERSGEVANRAHTRSSSISGAIKERQVEAHKGPLSLRDIALVAVEHGIEELAVELKDLVFLGLFREMLRGGKPELYFFARTSLTLGQVQERLPQAEHRRESRALTGLEFSAGIDAAMIGAQRGNAWKCRIAGSFDKISTSGNMTLKAGLLLSADYVRREAMERVERSVA
jgi:transcriptional regulator with XRE-family HTH domain